MTQYHMFWIYDKKVTMGGGGGGGVGGAARGEK